MSAGSDGALKVRGDDAKTVVVKHGSPLGVGLDADAVYWADIDHIWRAPRGSSDAKQVVEIDDAPTAFVVADHYVYWATGTTVRRAPAAGGTSETIYQSTIPHAHIKRLAISGHELVAAISYTIADEAFKTEVWRLDGDFRKLAEADGDAEGLVVDGARAVVGVLSKSSRQVISFAADGGSKAPDAPIEGAVLAARDGTVYVSRDDGSYAIDPSGVARRIGPRAKEAVVVGSRLYGVFEGPQRVQVLGSIAIR